MNMLNNWNDFDARLREIALIDVAVSEAAATRNEAMIAAETDYNTKASPLLAKRAALGDELEVFYKKHRKEVEAEGKRSIELTFGEAGMRKGNPTLSCIKGWKWDRVLETIKKRFARQADRLEALVTTKESVNKDGVKAAGFTDEELAAIGCKIKQDDEFWFKVFPDSQAASRAA
jgi:phage host-nuclease inhibitor protein Gam